MFFTFCESGAWHDQVRIETSSAFDLAAHRCPPTNATIPIGDFKRAGAFSGIVNLIEQFGGDPERLMAGFDLCPACFDVPERYLPYSRVIGLLEACAIELSSPHFGFELGWLQNRDEMGKLAILLCSAASVEESFQLLGRYMFVHAPGGQARLSIEDGQAYLSYRTTSPQSTFSRQGNEYAMAYGLRLIRVIIGTDFKPDFVMISSSPPAAAPGVLMKEFGCGIHYGQEISAIALAPDLLARKPRGSDPEKLAFMRQILEAIAPPKESETPARVKDLIVDLLPLGACKLPMVAKQLGLHPRTLQSRLLNTGVEFRDLVKEVRTELAESYLSTTLLPISDIAQLLGYSDQAAFTRAFSSCRGVSPKRFRLAHAA